MGRTAPDSAGSRYLIPCHDLDGSLVSTRFARDIARNSRRCGASLCFAVADDTGNDQVRIIHDRTKGHGQCIPQFTPFVDRPWGFRVDVAGSCVSDN